jgi:hypothetical protein
MSVAEFLFMVYAVFGNALLSGDPHALTDVMEIPLFLVRSFVFCTNRACVFCVYIVLLFLYT